MKTSAAIIALSLAANVGLFAYWHRPTPRTASPLPPASSPASLAVTATEVAQPIAPAASPMPSSSVPASRLRWSQLQSADLKECIARLRAVGCPEETIQDLIIAEVERRFAARRRSLFPWQYEERPFWKPYRQDNKTFLDLQKKQRALTDEQKALLIELFGFDPRPGRMVDEQLLDWQGAHLGYLPESKRNAVQDYLDEFQAKMQQFYETNNGLWDAQSWAEQRALEKEKERGLAALLTPEEFRQWLLRDSQDANQARADLRGLALSEQEYQNFVDIRRKYRDSVSDWSFLETQEEHDAADRAKKSMNEELRTALGDQLFKQYERKQDYIYQQLERITQRNDLAADTAAKVYDFKTASEDSAKQIRDDKSLTQQQRYAALQAIFDETQQAVKTALGEKGFKSFQRSGGWWLNSLKPPAHPMPKK